MALSNALNFYTYTQLNTYTYSEINGTLYFYILITVTGSRDIISSVSAVNSVDITFVSTSDIDKWECRATLNGQDYGVGKGLLVKNGNAVSENTQVKFNVPYSVLTLGDGKYRLSVYVQKNNIWYGE